MPNVRVSTPHGSRVLFLAIGLFAPAFGLAAQEALDPVAAGVQELEMAAGGPVRVDRLPLTGLASFVAPSGTSGVPVRDAAAATPEARALSFLGQYGRLFGLRRVEDLRHIRTNPRDRVGMDHVRFQQLHDGIPVTGGELIVHLRGSRVMAANGRVLPGLDELATTPLVGALAAETAAREVLAKHLHVTDAELSEPRLEVLDRGFIGGPRSPTRLAWFIEARKLDLRRYIWVDALRGGVLLNFSQLTDVRNRRVHTANNSPALPGTLVRSEGGPATGDEDTDLAYDYSGDTYDYFFNEHGRDSYDGVGGILRSTVHFCPPGECPYENAFWNGAQMVYGEGFPLADDVDAHELTHAVTERSAALFYYMQSGALNESFSDIFGETVDLTNGAGDDSPGVRWSVGEELPVFGAVRNMMDPSQSPFGDPARVGDSSHFKCFDSGFDDAGGVHSNSGVPNHAFALMVDGGTYNGQTVTGIGLTKAGKIQYRALTEYLISSSDFLDDYVAIQQSCQDLIGMAGITAGDCTEVKQALDAVEMSNPWPCDPAPAADPVVCPIGQGPVDLFFDDFENRTSGKWSTSIQTGPVNHWTGGSGSPGIYFSGFASSGLYHLWGYNFGTTALSSVAMTKSVTLPADAKMHFRHSHGFENSVPIFWDGGVLEYSTNGGASWVDAGTLISGGDSYGGSITTVDTNPLAGRQAFVGESWGYTSTLLDLSSLSGQSVRFRFRIGTDSVVDDYGWFIDDVRIYTCDGAGSVQFGAPVFSANEGSPTATVTVTRTGGNAAVSVDFATSDDSATAGSDYTATSGTLSFPSLASSRTFTVPITNDLLDDDAESFVVSLSNVSGPSATLGAQQTAQVDIVDNDIGGSVQFSAATYAMSEAGPVATITVTRLGGAAAGASVNFQTTVGGSATAGSDYSPVSGTLTFGAGVTSKTFTVPLVSDTIDETNETINLLLNAPDGGATLGVRTTAVLTIVDNDTAGVLQFSAVAYSISEGAGNATITVRRIGGLASGVSVQYTTEDGTALAGADYTTASGTLSFGANETLKTFTVPILEDSIGEANETVKLKLQSPTGFATLGAVSNSTLTIFENESVMEFSLPNYTITEAGPMALINVKRTLLSGTTTVHYSTSNGSATAGTDYAATSGDLTFGPGVALRTFSVPITNDTTQEPPELVLLSLSNAAGPGAALGRQATSALTITDNDITFRFSSATYAVNEGTANAVVTVQRLNSSAGTVSVDFAATAGSATAGADFTAVSGTLTFTPGVVARTFMVPIINDTDAEPSETVNLALSNFSTGTGPGSPIAASLTITDNEPGLRFSSATYSVGEATPAATITVQRVGPATGTATVDVSATSGSATAGSDFTAVNTTLTFTPGVLARTFTVPILNDTDAEGNETVNLAMAGQTGAGLAAPSTATLTIADNETLFRFSAASYTVGEAAPVVTITVQRLNSSVGTVTVDYAASGNTATDNVDFTAVSGTLTFGPGVMARTFTVPIVNDATAEGNETVDLTLTPGAGTNLGVPGAATLTITDNETLFRFSSATYTAAETTASAIITVQRLNSGLGTVTVDFAATGGSATPAVDFTPVSGTLSFGPGVLARTFSVPITNDTIDENGETVNLTLSNPGAGTNLGTPKTATLTITDNDTGGTVKLSAATYSAGESAGFVRIMLTRAGGTASTSLHYTLQENSSAQAGVDYTDNSGVVSFAAGELTKTFDVPILTDFDVEGNETFQISLSNPDPGTSLVSPTSAVIYIVDDDT